MYGGEMGGSLILEIFWFFG